MVNPAGHRRSKTCGNLWRQLRRLRHFGRGYFYTGSLCRSSRLRWRIKLVYLPEHNSALLETVPGSNARDGRGPSKRQRVAQWELASIKCAEDQSASRSEEHTSELQSRSDLVCRL